MPTPDDAPPGRSEPMRVSSAHFVLGTPLRPPFPDGLSQAVFAMGCFWGAERKFWELDDAYSTAVGYTAGFTPNPTYEEVCGGATGHTEAVLVVFDAGRLTFEQLLKVFWESHDPTQGMRQGNDLGTQYRSGIYYFDADQQSAATESCRRFGEALQDAGLDRITTEILPIGDFFYAEDYHQQYLAKNPAGYCGLGGTGVSI